MQYLCLNFVLIKIANGIAEEIRKLFVEIVHSFSLSIAITNDRGNKTRVDKDH